MKSGYDALGIVTLTVLLQLVAAALLKQAALIAAAGLFLALALVAVAIGIHGLRFLLWGYAHRRWPLSHTYPLTAIFFPIVVGMAVLYGEQIRAPQVLGSLLIGLGVAWLTFRKQDA